MISTADFRKGAKIEYKGEPCEIVDFQHVKMGRGGAVIRTKLKSLRTGNVLEDTFRSGEKFDSPQLEEKHMQYLYEQDDLHYFMDTETFEQIPLSVAQLGDIVAFRDHVCAHRQAAVDDAAHRDQGFPFFGHVVISDPS